MKAALRYAAITLAAISTLVGATACSTIPTESVKGVVARYNPDTRASGSAYFELEGVNGVFYCDANKIPRCSTTKDGDNVNLTYYKNAYGWLLITKLTRVE